MSVERSEKRRSGLASVFDWKNEYGKGRCCMLVSVSLSRILTDLTTGVLYTAFLTAYQFSVVEVGLMATLRLLSSCFSIFAPVILERFQKRKWILAAMRMTYYLLTLVVLTAVPAVIQNGTARVIVFGAVVLIAGILNNLFLSGYAVWHLNFIPESVRADYYSYQQIASVLISGIVLFGFSLVADRFLGSAHEVQALTIIRMIGFVIGVVDVLMLILPKEYAYPQKEKRIRFINILRLPLHCKKFMLTVMTMGVWDFALNLSTSAWNYSLLNDIGVGTTLMSMSSVIYTAALILLMPFWQKVLRRYSWLLTYAIAALVHAPSMFMFVYVNHENYLWLYTLGLIVQGVAGVALNLTALDFQYINTPRTDQTYYIAFFTLVQNLMAFLGQSTATLFVNWFGTRTLTVFGKELHAVQILLTAEGTIFVLVALFIILNIRALTPDPVSEVPEEQM